MVEAGHYLQMFFRYVNNRKETRSSMIIGEETEGTGPSIPYKTNSNRTGHPNGV